MMTVPLNRNECSQRRYQARYKIRAVLDEHDMSMSELARRIGVSAVSVAATVRGKNHSRKVLGALREIGVPEEYLFDPRITQAENE